MFYFTCGIHCIWLSLLLISPQVHSNPSEVLDQPGGAPAPLTHYHSLQVHLATHKYVKPQPKPASSCSQYGVQS